ncbi:MAG TPA: hypothetical protein DCL41_06730 [Bdellovibrionales bacterium]|nr:hypothetical protein [Bdellovibrionales bacterium]
MKSIRSKLFLLMSLIFGISLGLNLMAYMSFMELKSLRMQVELGNQMELELNQLPSDLKLTPGTIEKLKAKAAPMKPTLRLAGMELLLEKADKRHRRSFQKHFKTFRTNETEFRRYTLNQMNYLEKKVLFLTGLGVVGLLIGFAFLHSFIKVLVIKPIESLSSKMLDFLHNRYTYQFGVPRNDEIGNLHSSFNSLAQRVITHTDELKSLDQAKSDFLSIASHELRTPLTSIKGSLSLMRAGMAGDMNEVASELLGIAEMESDRLIRLINDLLDLAKIEAGKLPLTTVWVSASDLVQTTFKSLQGLSQSAGVDLVFENHAENVQVEIDQDRIQQVLTNLMSNAIKFSPKGDCVIARVILSDQEGIRFEVKDHGKGIDPEDQKLIFQKFRQVTGPNNPLVKGTGLGLAIAKAIVEEHQGEIGLTSKPGEGSTFFFTIKKWRFKSAENHAEAS